MQTTKVESVAAFADETMIAVSAFAFHLKKGISLFLQAGHPHQQGSPPRRHAQLATCDGAEIDLITHWFEEPGISDIGAGAGPYGGPAPETLLEALRSKQKVSA